MGNYIISKKIGDAFFWTICLLTIIVTLTLDSVHSLIYINSTISAFLFLFLGRTRVLSGELKKYLITLYIAIFYVFVFNLLGVHNSSAPYLYFLGTVIISLYEDRKMLFYYGFSTIAINLVVYFIHPYNYFINHNFINWFYITLIFTLHNFIFFYRIGFYSLKTIIKDSDYNEVD